MANKFYKERWFFESVMNNISVSVIVTDLEQTIIYVNGATEELFGYTEEEMIGKHPSFVNAEPSSAEIQRNIYKTAMDGGVWHNQILNEKKNGDLFVLDLKVSTLKNEEGKVIGLIGYQKDVTDIKVATEEAIFSENKYEKIFKNAPRLITLVYEDGTLKDCNDRMFEFLGYTKEEVIGKNVKMFFGESSHPLIRKNMGKIMGGEKQDEEYNMIRKDGEIINVNIKSTVAIDENNKKHTICFIADVTQSKKAEIELKELALELQQINSELEQFAYVASHDLQEPLRVVANYCEMLSDKCNDCPKRDEETEKWMRYTIEATERMKTLIKELLDFSRVGRKDSPFEYVNVYDIIKEVMLDYEIAITDSNAEIIIEDELPIIFAIRFRIKQLIANLLSNSLKFHSEKPPIVRIGCCDEGSFWLFYVKDNGIGIESQYFERVFGIFKRLYSREEYPGTGIGLALCKRIVETHGGKIWVDSDVKNGTWIYFTISKDIKLS